MPAGTVYCKYKPCYFGQLCVKGDSIPGDFYTGELTADVGLLAGNNSGEWLDLLDKYERTGESFDLDLEGEGRDGMYDEDQLFAVYERKDIEQLIARLQGLLT